MHASHSPLQPIRQYQTLQVFKEKRPAAFVDSDRAQFQTLYNKTITAKKDMSKMKVKAAGPGFDTLDPEQTPKMMKADLLETSFQISFQRELDNYKTSNQKLFPRHKLSAAMLEQERLLKENHKANDGKTNWNLKQVSILSQREGDMSIKI